MSTSSTYIHTYIELNKMEKMKKQKSKLNFRTHEFYTTSQHSCIPSPSIHYIKIKLKKNNLNQVFAWRSTNYIHTLNSIHPHVAHLYIHKNKNDAKKTATL